MVPASAPWQPFGRSLSCSDEGVCACATALAGLTSAASSGDIGIADMIKLTGIGHVNLRVADQEASKRFYRDVLGFLIAEEDPTMAACS